MHLGNYNQDDSDELGGEVLNTTKKEKDLEVIIRGERG